MITPGLDAPRLGRLLQDEVALLGDFVTLLKSEESLLLDAQTDALLALAEQKTLLYRRLQFLSDERARLFAAARLELNDANLRKCLAGNTPALDLWQRIIVLADEARSRNQLNGRLISERMQDNQHALAVLMAAAEQPAATYGPDGQSRPFLSGRRFGSI